MGGQCECPNWGRENWQNCIDGYYKEGPGGGHYDIMMNSNAKCVACGYGGGTMTNNFCNGEAIPAGSSTIVNPSSGKCLNIKGSGSPAYPDDLAGAILFPCGSDDNMQFIFENGA